MLDMVDSRRVSIGPWRYWMCARLIIRSLSGLCIVFTDQVRELSYRVSSRYLSPCTDILSRPCCCTYSGLALEERPPVILDQVIRTKRESTKKYIPPND